MRLIISKFFKLLTTYLPKFKYLNLNIYLICFCTLLFLLIYFLFNQCYLPFITLYMYLLNIDLKILFFYNFIINKIIKFYRKITPTFIFFYLIILNIFFILSLLFIKYLKRKIKKTTKKTRMIPLFLHHTFVVYLFFSFDLPDYLFAGILTRFWTFTLYGVSTLISFLTIVIVSDYF